MKPTPTRTLNPLPFQDLEPHRFEDLIRQLAYDLRTWKSLEATGRGGGDEGLDIRAVEVVRLEADSQEADAEEAEPVVEERLWTFQCKREKVLTPKRIREVIGESLASLAAPPYGFVLAVACDVSKKARDVFRDEMVSRGIESFAIWAKGELEDMLFQPKNDRLLFAYFGLSLQPRRRALSTVVRSEIAKKKQLTALIGEDSLYGKLVLLRDPRDERYPREPKPKEPRARWLLCRAMHLKSPGDMVVLRREFLAATTPDGKQWDAILSYDSAAAQFRGELRSLRAWALSENEEAGGTEHEFWREYIPDAERMFLKVYRWVPLERVLAIDPLGDGYYPIPHVLVEFDDKAGPFSEGERLVLEPADRDRGHRSIEPGKENRAEIFPNVIASGDSMPKRFDDTSEATLRLSADADAKLKALVQSIVENKKKRRTGQERDPAEERERARETLKPFREWRTSVALPLFSSFVRKLREEGHTARVVVRAVEGSESRAPSEWIELRVQLHLGSEFNPDYRANGHLRISFEFGQWRLDVYPPSEDARPRYSPPVPAPKLELMSRDVLEAQVLSMLERLQPRGSREL